MKPLVYFYIPPDKMPSGDLSLLTYDWPGFSEGGYCWTLRTFLALNEQGGNFFLTSKLPDCGIIISHSSFLPKNFQPSSSQLLVCIMADWPRHPFAQVHLTQNLCSVVSRLSRSDRYFYPGELFFVKHWMQSGLLPRDIQRKSLVENIAYIGRRENLTPQLLSNAWRKDLESHGLKWHIVDDPLLWHDYSNFDVVISVRDFPVMENIHKPASKLVNAWAAGVPGIFSAESAFMSLHTSDIDFIPVNKFSDILPAILRLKNDSCYYDKMVANGIKRSQAYSNKKIADDWLNLIDKELVQIFVDWRSKKIRRFLFRVARKLSISWKKLVN